MKVWCAPASKGASGNLRITWPALTLVKQGHDASALPLTFTMEMHYDAAGHVREIARPDCDVLVMQRNQNRQVAEAIPLLQQQGVAVVMDVDDAFCYIDPNNVAYAGAHPSTNPDVNWKWLAKACRLADLVTVTTPALADIYGRHGRVRVLPNRLPRQVLSIAHTDGLPLRVGWPGDIGVHPRDLQVTQGAVGRVVDRLGLRYVNVGPGGTAAAIGVTTELVTGEVPSREWYAALARHIDIGIVPLADTAFNQAKSGLKLLELASTGVPAVASPTSDNRRLHALGLGVLARKPREWAREVTRLATDHVWRAELAARSKAAAAGEVLEAHVEGWWEAWGAAVDYHATRHSG